MRASTEFYHAAALSCGFSHRQITPLHQKALLAGRDRAIKLQPSSFVVIAFGSAARGDTSSFSDVDVAAVVKTDTPFALRESFLCEDIVVNISFYDLLSFIQVYGTRDPWEAMWKSILIQGTNAVVLYDPAGVWPKIASACLVEPETDLSSSVIDTFWTGSVIYLGKLISAAQEGDNVYGIEVGGILARNICYIVLALNGVPPISNRYLLIQSSRCEVKPENYVEDFTALYGMLSDGSLWNMAKSGLRLCKQTQQILQAYSQRTSILVPNLEISFHRYQDAINCH